MLLSIINAILPIILILFLGYFLKKINIISDNFLSTAFSLVYKIFLPCLMFFEIATIDSFKEFDFSFLLFIGIMIIVSLIIGFVHSLLLKDKPQRAIITQGAFNSNFLLIGIPIINSLFNKNVLDNLFIASVVFIPVVNFFSVFIISLSSKEKNFKKIILDLIKNPLILSALFGLISLSLKQYLNVDLLSLNFVSNTFDILGKVTVGFGLLIIGAKFNFSNLKRYRFAIFIGTYLRLLLIPFFVLSIFTLLQSYDLVNPTPSNYIILIILFATPLSIGSSLIAKDMHCEEDLANSLILVTTILSLLTMAGTIYLLRDFILL